MSVAIILLFATCFNSCSKSGADVTSTAFVNFHRLHNVTSADIQNYILGIKGLTKASDVSVEPILNGLDTVMFLVNYEDGWEVLSGDKRLSRTLAKADKGHITVSDLLDNPATGSYFNELSRNIASIRSNDSFIPPVDAPDTWRVLHPIDSIFELVDVLVSIDTTVISAKYQDHLMETKWGQLSPWNQYAPYMDSTRTNRGYTGCVMVAASQLLYYLHDKCGVPVYTYGAADCNAYIPSSNSLVLSSSDVSFSDYGDHWSSMPLTSAGSGSNYVSALMVWIGYLYSAIYTRTGTGSWSHNAVGVFPVHFSTNCQSLLITSSNFGSFVGLVEDQIYNNQIPVIAAIYTYDSAGHAVVIDGYNYTKKKIEYYYAVYEVPYGGLIMPGQTPVRYYTRTTYDESCFVAINWGWNGLGNEDSVTGETIWYNLYGSWLAGGYTFTHVYECVYGFQPIN